MHREFPTSIDHLYDMLKFILECAKKIDFTTKEIMRIELVAEEALVNIIHHSGLTKDNKIGIACSLIDTSGFKIVIDDEGVSFNPLLNKRVSLEEQLGGYGVHLIVALMDEVHYDRMNNRNVLTLVKFKSLIN